jgi:hypothetical protein
MIILWDSVSCIVKDADEQKNTIKWQMCRVKTTASAWGDCKLPTPICNILQPVGYAILRTISYALDIRLSSVLRVWSKFCTISLPFFAVPCSAKVLLRLQRLIQALFLQLDLHLLLFLSQATPWTRHCNCCCSEPTNLSFHSILYALAENE